VYQEYQWEYQGLRHIAVHGHQFDGFVVSNVRVSYYIGTLLYLQLQKWDSKNKTLTRFLDRLNTRWLRLSPKVAEGALAHARHHHAARIFCGHTHAACTSPTNTASTISIAEPGLMRIPPISRLAKQGVRSMNT
jgi:hypothetical protein